MAEVIEEPPAPPEFSPDNSIEQLWDMYTPSGKYSELSVAIQKDIVLGNIKGEDEPYLDACMKIIESANRIHRHTKMDTTALVKDNLKDIAFRIAKGRGRAGFTAELMRKSMVEAKQTYTQRVAQEKGEGWGTKIKRLVPI